VQDCQKVPLYTSRLSYEVVYSLASHSNEHDRIKGSQPCLDAVIYYHLYYLSRLLSYANRGQLTPRLARSNEPCQPISGQPSSMQDVTAKLEHRGRNLVFNHHVLVHRPSYEFRVAGVAGIGSF
jgi:hypothetical protein